MTLNKATIDALCAAMEMARADDALVTVADVARRYHLSATALAKVFQQLVRAGLAEGTRGIHGGYRLTRPASGITVLEVIAAFERPQALTLGPPGPPASGPAAPDAPLRRLFGEVDELVQSTLASVTLQTLVRRQPRGSHARD